LAIKQGELFRQLEEDDLNDRMLWSLSESPADLPGFVMPDERRGIVIDISDKERLRQDFIPVTDRHQQLLETSAAWPVGKLANWLDRSFAHPDLTEAETGIYLTRVVGGLTDKSKFTLEALTAHRHRLAKAVEEKIKTIRAVARKAAMETFLIPDASSPVFVTAAATFTFNPNKYPYTDRYQGLPFTRHYYEVVGDLKGEGEEYQCARVIDSLEQVDFWVRNIEREPDASFWIQTSSDRFYPDFVCKLKNGKVLVVEYKGGDRATNEDTKEKERLGELWQARSDGQCVFVMVKTPNELGKIQTAAKAACPAS